MWGLWLPLLVRCACPLQAQTYSSIQAAADAAKRWEAQGEWEQSAAALEEIAERTPDHEVKRRVLERAAWIRNDRLHDASAARRLWLLLWSEEKEIGPATPEERLLQADLAWLVGKRNLAADRLFTLVSPESNEKTGPALDAATRLMERGLARPSEFDALLEALLQGEGAPPPSGKAFLFHCGKSLLQAGKTSRALEILRAQMRLYPQVDTLWIRSGGLLLSVLRNQGDREPFRDTWKAMWSSCKNADLTPTLRAELGRMMEHAVSPRSAGKIFEKALNDAKEPGDRVAPLWGQSLMLEDARDWAGALNALADLKETFRLSPGSSTPTLSWRLHERQSRLIKKRLGTLCRSGFLAEPKPLELSTQRLPGERVEAPWPQRERLKAELPSGAARQILCGTEKEALYFTHGALLYEVPMKTEPAQVKTYQCPWGALHAAAFVSSVRESILFLCDEGVGHFYLKEKKADLWPVQIPAWRKANHPRTLLLSSQGEAAVQSGSVILLQDADLAWHRVFSPTMNLLAADAKGRFWAMDPAGVVSLGRPGIPGQRWIELPPGAEALETVTHGLVDGKDNLWLVGPLHYALGLRLASRTVITPPSAHPASPPGKAIPTAAVCLDGGLWMAAGEELIRYSLKERRWTQYTLPRDAQRSCIRHLQTGPDNNLWLVSNRGVYSLETNTGAWRFFF